MHKALISIFLAAAMCSSSAFAQADNKSGQTNYWLNGLPVAVAIVAAIIAYLFNIRLEKRKSRLKFVSDQLQYLYGPLTALSNTSSQAWKKFRESHKPGGAFFDPSNPPTAHEIQAWRLWMQKVFMPLNISMEEIIIANAHLIDDEIMPECFRDLLAHVETYKAVIEKWSSATYHDLGNFDKLVLENTASINFPKSFDSHVSAKFIKLKSYQAELMGRHS